jgi:hypothetical protein
VLMTILNGFIRSLLFLGSAHPEMVDCGPDLGRSEVEPAGVAALR